MDFKDKTIKEVKELTEQFKKQNPDVKTAEELLEPKCKCGDKEKNHHKVKGFCYKCKCQKFVADERPKVLDMTELI